MVLFYLITLVKMGGGMMSAGRRNRRTALLACLVIVGMLGLTAASVPLYDLFCAVTGYGGTPQIDAEAARRAAGRRARITVQFNADVDARPALAVPARCSAA